MRVALYTLANEDIADLQENYGEFVSNLGKNNYFSIGAYTESDEEDKLLGVAQFYLNINDDGECYAVLDYIYVNNDIRRQGVGTKLIDKANRVLKMSDVKTSIIDISGNLSSLPEDEASFCGFLKESGYIAEKSGNTGGAKRFVRFTGK